jgi:AraC family transcriptional regulator
MGTHIAELLTSAGTSVRRSRQWVREVISLLDTAARQLQPDEQAVQRPILEAASLLRAQIEPESGQDAPDGRGRLPTWQARRVCDFIETQLTGPISVADLCALVHRSEAHFSRAFRRTFGESPHAFVVRRRVELAAQCMLQTDAPLSDIAQHCGFTDQAHLCKLFRRAMGQSPSAWRRLQRSHDAESGVAYLGRFAASRNAVAAPRLARARTALTQSRVFSPEPLLRTGS